MTTLLETPKKKISEFERKNLKSSPHDFLFVALKNKKKNQKKTKIRIMRGETWSGGVFPKKNNV
jgi:hypothetical protein